MKVYKFGGASISSALGVRNLCRIVSMSQDDLFVVVSAMGKVTNALESVVEALFEGDVKQSNERIASIANFHYDMTKQLGVDGKCVDSLIEELKGVAHIFNGGDYDLLYDSIVSYGEILSSSIVALAMQNEEIDTTLVDIRKIFVTNNSFRQASVDINLSKKLLLDEVKGGGVFLTQGFIGATKDGEVTTLGREGSDYSAALIAAMVDADSLTIWKDVQGVLNCDPKYFDDAILIEHLTYLDAVELSYSGAQIIHPKTIKPLAQSNIPLYVKSFSSPMDTGTLIDANESNITIPIIIVKPNQILLSIRERDFSFAVDDSLSEVLEILKSHRQKVNLVQSSAVSLSVSIDESRYFCDMLKQLEQRYAVKYNKGLELITIRGYNEEQIRRHTSGYTLYARQQTRRSFRAVRKKA